MNVERTAELLRRLFMWGALVLLALAVVEKIANLAGQTVIRATFLPSDLATYATTLAVFAIAFLLWGVRSELRNR